MEPADATFSWSVFSTFSARAALGLLRGNATSERLARTMGETIAVGASCAAVAYLVGWIVGG
jgi:VIT1/CCC1 family predicted Fe2+/Mn2+ transporter